jgi:hypothetical protein
MRPHVTQGGGSSVCVGRPMAHTTAPGWPQRRRDQTKLDMAAPLFRLNPC